ncbi:hypothetical protein DFR24_3561 [Panacagrimonas perspica]|uniref:Uncharacterized protein n=1 Tax=Panacagrimonas perspica TaxID=381431 RepID=A0A4S3K2E0_9GAMM|nr:hypothetical protein [Panacagrimonas perspica]TDU26533.1 hypothetical protein DFR24_3561 [Panacagrimonas perspica]THD02139.1 hypothetical protein B1810_16875 [Panacagrimonas perspica]
MISLAQGLMAASAAMAFSMGTGHLWLTFASRKFHPRDPQTEVRMKQDAPQLTRRTSMWNAWIGFNGSHSMGPMLFGAIYAYLALFHGAMLFASTFLLGLGLLTLLGYLVLGLRYWFRMPVTGLLIATACYLGAIAVAPVGATVARTQSGSHSIPE